MGTGGIKNGRGGGINKPPKFPTSPKPPKLHHSHQKQPHTSAKQTQNLSGTQNNSISPHDHEDDEDRYDDLLDKPQKMTQEKGSSSKKTKQETPKRTDDDDGDDYNRLKDDDDDDKAPIKKFNTQSLIMKAPPSSPNKTGQSTQPSRGDGRSFSSAIPLRSRTSSQTTPSSGTTSHIEDDEDHEHPKITRKMQEEGLEQSGFSRQRFATDLKDNPRGFENIRKQLGKISDAIGISAPELRKQADGLLSAIKNPDQTKESFRDAARMAFKYGERLPPAMNSLLHNLFKSAPTNAHIKDIRISFDNLQNKLPKTETDFLAMPLEKQKSYAGYSVYLMRTAESFLKKYTPTEHDPLQTKKAA